MKKITIPIRIAALLLFALFCNKTSAQGNFGVGAYAGGGVLSGNSPNQTSFTSSLFFEFKTPFTEIITPRISFIYTQDFNKLLPNTTNKYYPFLRGWSIKGIASQDLSENYFLEEGAGFLVLNDHTFSDINEWNYGVVFSIAAGLELKNNNLTSWRLGVGTEYGFSFANTFAKYFSLHLQVVYTF